MLRVAPPRRAFRGFSYNKKFFRFFQSSEAAALRVAERCIRRRGEGVGVVLAEMDALLLPQCPGDAGKQAGRKAGASGGRGRGRRAEVGVLLVGPDPL